MKFKDIVITGGAGFVGSNLALRLKADFPTISITCLDNLKRRGSELNLTRLQEAGIKFIHGDIRNPEDLTVLEGDLIIECSAEPSVLAGLDGNPGYVINSNLVGTLNCLEVARRNQAAFFFLSTSRVYPYKLLDSANYSEERTRFVLSDKQDLPGISRRGVSEEFPLSGSRSIYGATKLASELMIEEYRESYGLRAVINRYGVIAGPGQMGKVDQGVLVFWLAKHLFGGDLSYIGYGGKGKQVRDFLHIEDCYRAIKLQISDFDQFEGQIYNIGGGVKNSLSLLELTALAEKAFNRKIKIREVKENRPADVRIYLSDYSLFGQQSGWKPTRDCHQLVDDVAEWMTNNQSILKGIFG